MWASILSEWASLIFRWLHVIAAIGWIGSSFYFIHLDLELKPREGLPEGAYGDAWHVVSFSVFGLTLLLLYSIYALYHLPIWVTEFALTNFSGGTETFPTEAQQAAFLTAATQMLDGLSYVQRYAWFALPATSATGTTGLFNPGPAATEVGRAFEEAR